MINMAMKIIQLKGRYEHQDKQNRYERTYYFYDEQGELYSSCEVYGQCLNDVKNQKVINI